MRLLDSADTAGSGFIVVLQEVVLGYRVVGVTDVGADARRQRCWVYGNAVARDVLAGELLTFGGGIRETSSIRAKGG